MRNAVTIMGALLILAGIGVFAFQGYSYTKEEQVLKFGELEVTAQRKEHVHLPPILGGAAIVVGVVLVAIGIIRKR